MFSVVVSFVILLLLLSLIFFCSFLTFHNRYALRGLLTRLEGSSPASSFNRIFLDCNLTAANPRGGETANGISGVGRMPPPVGNALETARLLTLKIPPPISLGVVKEGSTTGADDEDGAWELQRKLVASEFGEGGRSLDSLMEELIKVGRLLFAAGRAVRFIVMGSVSTNMK